MEEIWKPIPGFEKSYAVSNLGNVKCLPRSVVGDVAGKMRQITERLLRPYPGGKGQGYLRVCLSIDNKKTIKIIHRLVAELFVTAVPGKSDVNHIDGNRFNNRWDNLEWCTKSENMQHYWDLKRKRAHEKNGSLVLEIM